MSGSTEFEKLKSDIRSYLSMRYDLMRLEVLEKLSLIIAMIVVLFVSVVLGLAALIYFSFVFAFALRDVFGGSVVPGFCIIGGMFLIMLAVLVVFRNRLVVNPLIRALGSILFHEEDKDKEKDESSEDVVKDNAK